MKVKNITTDTLDSIENLLVNLECSNLIMELILYSNIEDIEKGNCLDFLFDTQKSIIQDISKILFSL